jgi:hypothetical protein
MNFQNVFALLLVLCFFIQSGSASHVVGEQEIRTQLLISANDRAAKIEAIEKLLRHESVQAQIGRIADLTKIEQALPALDDETIDRLATESQKLSDELEGGELCAATIALIALIAAVIVVAIVAYA